MNTILRRPRAGFTLTELMAVVIILAILAGVAAGSFKKAIERSHFSEGLIAANTVLGAVERYYAETCNEGACVEQPKISYLDVGLSNQRDCSPKSDYCTKTKYFEVKVLPDGVVEAVRMKGSQQGDYTIRVYAETFGDNPLASDECVYTTDGGKDLCISMGYGDCDTHGYCSK